MFDIRLNEEQRAFQQMAREFAETEIKPIALELDARPNWEDRIPWEVLKKGSQLGFRSFVLQEENGGAGASDHLTSCVVAEELAAADIGTAYYYMLTARRARDWFELRMTQEQRDYFLPRFLKDDTYFTTIAIHEPDTDLGFDYFTETPPDVKFKTSAVKKKIDGKNTIFSEYTKKFQISESVYDVYDFIIRNQNIASCIKKTGNTHRVVGTQKLTNRARLASYVL